MASVFDSYDRFMKEVDNVFEAVDIARSAADGLEAAVERGDGPHLKSTVDESVAQIRSAAQTMQEAAGRLL